MKSRLKRPLLAAVVGGSLFAGVAVATGTASAAPVVTTRPVLAAEPVETTPPTTTPATTPPTTTPATTPPTTTPATTPPTTTPATTPPTTTPPPTPDTTAPTGTFKLNSSALWVGQQIALTQVDVKDNGQVDPATVTRVVAWGDGKSTTLKPKEVGKYKYTRAGTFPITLTLTDAAGNKLVKSWPAKITVPGKVTFSKSAVWHNERFNVTFSSIPAGISKITLRYGDGSGAVLKGKNQTVGKSYRLQAKGGLMPPGRVTLTAEYVNRFGATSQIAVGSVTIKRDQWAPTAKITKPKNPNRLSSWKTLRGTAADKGAGVFYVNIIGVRVNGEVVYCYTTQRAWIRVVSENDLIRCGQGINVPVVNGKWSLPLKGMKKGDHAFGAWATDHAWLTTPDGSEGEVIATINRN